MTPDRFHRTITQARHGVAAMLIVIAWALGLAFVLLALEKLFGAGLVLGLLWHRVAPAAVYLMLGFCAWGVFMIFAFNVRPQKDKP